MNKEEIKKLDKELLKYKKKLEKNLKKRQKEKIKELINYIEVDNYDYNCLFFVAKNKNGIIRRTVLGDETNMYGLAKSQLDDYMGAVWQQRNMPSLYNEMYKLHKKTQENEKA